MKINPEQYCVIRCDRAGAFFAKIAEYDPATGVADLLECRRLWYWEGAASLSQLAVDGTKNPNGCKFTVTVESMTVAGVIELIPATDKAVKSIKAVREWKL